MPLLGGGLYQLIVNLKYPFIRRCNGWLYIVKFAFVEYEVS